ncbi:hypothetical protein FisN_5Lh139 [Fistulifera solaris]|uniref:Leucine-rich repeat-containing N-terminal plant-type domain-containing protein n=1 Tax=Fistulifera solaris TaxID=1519565 RepID=A0A1Z5JIY3_FISSO|nr:hypothetical protein FisN_5Lh139 [Fistulifera solaris]|eukprot:GAX13954.1 hypothetical protein FisN_5Lh139 [Fistulifera solaris]
MFRTAFFLLFTLGGADAALKRMRNQSYEIKFTNRRAMTENRFTDKHQVEVFLDTLMRDYDESNLEMQSMSMSFPVQPIVPPSPSGSVVTPPVASPVLPPISEGLPVSAPTEGSVVTPTGEETPVSSPTNVASGTTPTGEESPVSSPTEGSPIVTPTGEGSPVSMPTEGSPVSLPTEGSPVSMPTEGSPVSPTVGFPVATPGVSPVSIPSEGGLPASSPTDNSVVTPTGETSPVSSPTAEAPIPAPIVGSPGSVPTEESPPSIPTVVSPSVTLTPVQGSPIAPNPNGSPVATPSGEAAPTNILPQASSMPVVAPTGAALPTSEVVPSTPTAIGVIPSVSPSSSVVLQPDEAQPTVDSLSSDFPSDIPSLSLEPSITNGPSTTQVPTFPGRSGIIVEKCGIEAELRSTELVMLFSNVSNPVVGLTPGSPEWWARMWLDQEDGYIACPENGRDTVERYVLVLLYFATQGDAWASCSTGDLSCEKRWLSDEHHCDWYGVSCDTAKQVTKLVMKDNGLNGPLPSEIYALSSLVQLSLDHNHINGTISSSIGSLKQLQILELDDNKMSGVLPGSLYSIAALRALDLNNNTFVGGLSSDIANLTELMVLQVENNNFTEPLPVVALSRLENLILFSSHGNQFAGSFEDICKVLSTRRETNPTYLQLFATDCSAISCSCCSECF